MGVEVTISKKVDIKSLSLEERLNLAHSSKDDKIHKALAVDEASEVKVALLNRLNLSEDAIDILFNDKDEKVVSALKEYFRNEIRKGTYLYDLVNVYTFSKIVLRSPATRIPLIYFPIFSGSSSITQQIFSFRYWLLSMYQEKPPIPGLKRRMTLASRMTIIATHSITEIQVASSFMIFCSFFIKSSLHTCRVR